MSRQWATVRDVAKQLRLSADEVRRRARTGEIPDAFKDGNRTMFYQDVIDGLGDSMPKASA